MPGRYNVASRIEPSTALTSQSASVCSTRVYWTHLAALCTSEFGSRLILPHRRPASGTSLPQMRGPLPKRSCSAAPPVTRGDAAPCTSGWRDADADAEWRGLQSESWPSFAEPFSPPAAPGGVRGVGRSRSLMDQTVPSETLGVCDPSSPRNTPTTSLLRPSADEPIAEDASWLCSPSGLGFDIREFKRNM